MEPPLLDKAALNRLRVGDRVLVWYSGAGEDGVWHERLLVRPVSSTLWFVATPEGEAYLEWMGGGVSVDSPVKCVRMVNGRLPEGLRGGTRLFTSEVSESEWGRLRDASEEACAGPPYASVLLRGEETWFDEAATPRVPEAAAAFGMDAGPLPMTDDDVWLLSSALLDSKGKAVCDAGVEMKVGGSDLLGAKFGIHFLASGEEVVVERVPRGSVARFSPMARVAAPGSVEEGGAVAGLAGSAGPRVKLTKEAGVEESVRKDDGDIRTLAVEYDSSGRRRRDWRSAASAVKECSLPDWPMSGPRSVLWLSSFFVSLSPSQWLKCHLQAEGWSPTDRSVQELCVIAEVLEMAAQYDQLNLGALACMERLCRRWQAVLEAHLHGPSQFDHAAAGTFYGTGSSRACGAPLLRAHAAKEMKDEAGFDQEHLKRKDLREGGRGGARRLGKESGGGCGAPASDD